LDVSEDGSVVAGATQVAFGDNPQQPRALRWANGALTPLITDTTYTSAAMLVRGAGSVILGAVAGSLFRWTEATGVDLVGTLPNDLNGFYELGGASKDGSIFAGTRNVGGGAGQAFRYTETTGMIGLEPMATYPVCGAVHTSDDGTVVV